MNTTFINTYQVMGNMHDFSLILFTVSSVSLRQATIVGKTKGNVFFCVYFCPVPYFIVSIGSFIIFYV